MDNSGYIWWEDVHKISDINNKPPMILTFTKTFTRDGNKVNSSELHLHSLFLPLHSAHINKTNKKKAKSSQVWGKGKIKGLG